MIRIKRDTESESQIKSIGAAFSAPLCYIEFLALLCDITLGGINMLETSNICISPLQLRRLTRKLSKYFRFSVRQYGPFLWRYEDVCVSALWFRIVWSELYQSCAANRWLLIKTLLFHSKVARLYWELSVKAFSCLKCDIENLASIFDIEFSALVLVK